MNTLLLPSPTPLPIPLKPPFSSRLPCFFCHREKRSRPRRAAHDRRSTSCAPGPARKPSHTGCTCAGAAPWKAQLPLAHRRETEAARLGNSARVQPTHLVNPGSPAPFPVSVPRGSVPSCQRVILCPRSGPHALWLLRSLRPPRPSPSRSSPLPLAPRHLQKPSLPIPGLPPACTQPSASLLLYKSSWNSIFTPGYFLFSLEPTPSDPDKNKRWSLPRPDPS